MRPHSSSVPVFRIEVGPRGFYYMYEVPGAGVDLGPFTLLSKTEFSPQPRAASKAAVHSAASKNFDSRVLEPLLFGADEELLERAFHIICPKLRSCAHIPQLFLSGRIVCKRRIAVSK